MARKLTAYSQPVLHIPDLHSVSRSSVLYRRGGELKSCGWSWQSSPCKRTSGWLPLKPGRVWRRHRTETYRSWAAGDVLFFSYAVSTRSISSSRAWNFAGSLSRCSSEHSLRQRGGSISFGRGIVLPLQSPSRTTLHLLPSKYKICGDRDFQGKTTGSENRVQHQPSLRSPSPALCMHVYVTCSAQRL